MGRIRLKEVSVYPNTFKNVFHQKWYSEIKYKGDVIHLGYYEDEEDAFNAYKHATIVIGMESEIRVINDAKDVYLEVCKNHLLTGFSSGSVVEGIFECSNGRFNTWSEDIPEILVDNPNRVGLDDLFRIFSMDAKGDDVIHIHEFRLLLVNYCEFKNLKLDIFSDGNSEVVNISKK